MVRFASEDGAASLAGRIIPSAGHRAIVMVHGLDSYAWDVVAREIAEAYVAAGFDVLVYDSRAQGASSGKRLGLGWAERSDVAAAVSLLLDRSFKPRRIGRDTRDLLWRRHRPSGGGRGVGDRGACRFVFRSFALTTPFRPARSIRPSTWGRAELGQFPQVPQRSLSAWTAPTVASKWKGASFRSSSELTGQQ